jgi:hypothetical protein
MARVDNTQHPARIFEGHVLKAAASTDRRNAASPGERDRVERAGHTQVRTTSGDENGVRMLQQDAGSTFTLERRDPTQIERRVQRSGCMVQSGVRRRVALGFAVIVADQSDSQGGCWRCP